MIDFYFYPTPNTWKVGIMLEECALPYRVIGVDLMKEEQLAPAFVAISPNGRVPAIVDHSHSPPLPLFESGAILVYLAEKTGRFLPLEERARAETLQWLFWQMGGLGPMSGQAGFFRRSTQTGIDYAIDRYTNEVGRLLGVLDRQLQGREWIAGEYGIADMACWGWVWFHPVLGHSLRDFPNVERWLDTMGQRPAVRKAKTMGLDMISEESAASYRLDRFPENRAS